MSSTHLQGYCQLLFRRKYYWTDTQTFFQNRAYILACCLEIPPLYRAKDVYSWIYFLPFKALYCQYACFTSVLFYLSNFSFFLKV